MFSQDNKTLEEEAEKTRDALESEREELEKKADFLHFTQEQLNIHIMVSLILLAR